MHSEEPPISWMDILKSVAIVAAFSVEFIFLYAMSGDVF